MHWTIRPVVTWCLCACVLATMPTSAWSAEIVVAATGSDANPGTLALPKATIAAGIAMLPKDGGTVFIRGGTYPQNKALRVAKSGAGTDARVMIAAYQNEPVKIVGSLGNTVEVFASFVTLSGLEITQGEVETNPKNDDNKTKDKHRGGHGILIWKCRDVTVIGCTIHHVWGSGIFVGSDDYDAEAKTSSTRNLLFENNLVHHTCLSNRARTAKGWGQGISSFFSVGTVIRGNRVYKNWGEGINLCGNDRAVAEGNVIYDNYSVNLYLDYANNATVRNNLLYTSNDPDRMDFFPYWSMTKSPGNGILLANEHNDKQTNSGHWIYNNISINCDSGVHVSGMLADSVIAHNTIVVGTAWGTGIGGGDKAVNCSLVNNIIVSSGRNLGGVSEKGQWISDRNLWFGGRRGGVTGANDVTVDPLFLTGSGLVADGYRLQPSSPAINVGTTLSEVASDYWGNPRPQGSAVDLGACEFGKRSEPKPATSNNKQNEKTAVK
jgi:parallel beta-helix repeat protein